MLQKKLKIKTERKPLTLNQRLFNYLNLEYGCSTREKISEQFSLNQFLDLLAIWVAVGKESVLI